MSNQQICKFNEKCTRKNCIYTHTAIRAIDTPKTCKFNGACTNVNCTFYHSVARPALVCKFGKKCSKSDCKYLHSDVTPAKPIADVPESKEHVSKHDIARIVANLEMNSYAEDVFDDEYVEYDPEFEEVLAYLDQQILDTVKDEEEQELASAEENGYLLYY